MAAGVANDELAELVVSLSADITRYQKDMAKVVGVTAKAAGDSERAWTAANQNIARQSTQTFQRVGQSVGAVRAEVGNLASQFQDIAVQLRGGGNPFTVAMQQGTQIGAVLQQAGQQGGSAFAILGRAALSALSPVNLISIGLIAAVGYAIKYFTAAKDGGEDSNQELKAQVQLLDQIAKAYQDINPALAGVVARLKEMSEVKLGISNLQDLRDQIAQAVSEAGGKLSQKLPALRFQFMPGSGDQKALDAVVERFKELPTAIKDGTAGVEEINSAFNDLLALIEKMDQSTAIIGLRRQLESARQTMVDTAKDLEPVNQQLSDLKIPDEFRPDLVEVNKQLKILGDIGTPKVDDLTKAFQALEAGIAASNGNLAEIVKLMDAFGKATDAVHDENIGKVADSIASAGSDYAKILKQIESAGGKNIKNPLSSASGPYQFINSTFIETLKQIPKYAGLSNDELLALKDNATVADEAFEKFTSNNVEGLVKAGVAVNDLSKYMAHLLGVAGAIAVLKAPPDTLVSKLLTPGAISANKSLLGGGITAGQATQNIQDFWNRGARATNVPGTDTQLKDAQDTVELEKQILAINQDLTKSEAERAASIAALRKETELLNQAKKDGLDKDAGTLASIKQVRDETYANVLATEQLKDARKRDSDAAREQARAAARFAEELGGVLKSGFSTFISDLREGKSAGEAFADMLDKIIDGLINMAIEALFSKQAMGSLFSGLGSILGGGAGVASQGGRVGQLGTTRHGLSPFAFAGAPRMARGGFVGVRPGEYPTILHRGEVVIPAAAVRRAGMGPYGSGSGGDSTRVDVGDISIATNIQGTGDVRSDSERGKAMGESVLAMIRGELVRQSRPGGLLRASGSGGRVGS